ncbi:Ubiquitin carboxyl-terminal hydrolase 23-like protein [Drosera capensis]
MAIPQHRLDESGAAPSSSSATPSSAGVDVVSICGRRIEFQLERKPYNPVRQSSGCRIETLNPKPPSPTTTTGRSLLDGGGGVGSRSRRSDGVEAWENGLDPIFASPVTFRRIGAGLQNLGNTCFLNAVLQCLTYTEPLAAYLQSGKHNNSCRRRDFCALCAIQRHVSNALQNTGRTLAPKDLVSRLRSISRNFRLCRQEDAHEFMIHLLESMHKCCLPSGVPTESPTAYEKSLVHKIFGGRLRSRVKCLQCSHCSDKFDPFLDLSLEIARADSLHKALLHFTAAEKLDDGEKHYHCEKCRQKVKALKQLTVDKAPYVLAFHLKRFGSHFSGQKIDRKVHFGPAIDMKHFVSGAYGEGDLRYTLYGVLVHAGGSTHSGHYYCFVRTSSGMWYSLDDNRVSQVSERIVLEQKAYMLFYVRDINRFSQKKPLIVNQNVNGVATTLRNVSTADTDRRSLPSAFTGKLSNGLLSMRSATVSVTQVIHKDHSVLKGSGTIASEDSAVRKDEALATKSSMGDIAQPMEKTENISVAFNATDASVTNAEAGCEDKNFDSNPNSVEKSSSFSLASKIAVNADSKEPPKTNSDEQIRVCSVPKNKQSDLSAEKTDSDHQSTEMQGGRETHKAQNSQISQSDLKKPSKLPPMNGNATAVCSDHVSWRKSKKHKKCRGSSVHFGTKMMLRAPLTIRKKNGKKKKVKDQKPDVGHLSDTVCKTVDTGPSTSEKANSVSSGKSVHSFSQSDSGSRTDEKGDAGKNTLSMGGNLPSENFRRELKERMDQSDGVVTISTTERNQVKNGRQKSSIDTSTCHVQKGKESVVALGLEKSIIGRWDEAEVASSKNLDSNGSVSRTIGYVGDDWDEEYDKGKRKKVKRSRISFDGPNPFQEIATKKAKLKMERKR